MSFHLFGEIIALCLWSAVCDPRCQMTSASMFGKPARRNARHVAWPAAKRRRLLAKACPMLQAADAPGYAHSVIQRLFRYFRLLARSREHSTVPFYLLRYTGGRVGKGVRKTVHVCPRSLSKQTRC